MPQKILALILIALMGIGMAPVYADGIDSIVPEIQIDGVEVVDSEEYPMSAYTFDTGKLGFTDIIPSALKIFTNILFFLNVLISKLVNYILVQAFQLDIFEYIEVVFNDLIISLGDAIYQPLIGILIPIVGISILFFAVVNKTTKAMSLFFQTIIILIVAAAFMTAPSFVISMVNDVSEEVAGSSLSATATIVNGRKVGSSDAVVSLSNIYWGNAVSNPWQLIQIGELDPQKAEEYLSASEEQREKMAKDESNTLFNKNYQWLRLVLALFFVLLNLVQSVLILVLAGIMILTQFAAILAAVVAVLGFAISLLPNQGLRVAIHAIYNVFTFLLTRIAIMLLMCIYFAVATVLYRNVNTAGWLFTLILQVLLILAVVIYKDSIFSFVKSAPKGAQSSIQTMHEKPNFKRAALEGYAAMKIGTDVKRVWDRRATRRLERKFEPTAEQYLYKRYNDERAYAEKHASENGKVEYSEFVRKTDARVERGFTPFSVDDLGKATSMMVNIHRQGEDPDRLVMTQVSGKTDDEIRSDQRKLESHLKNMKNKMKVEEDRNENTINRVIRTDPESGFYDRRRALVEGARAFMKPTDQTAYYDLSKPETEIEERKEQSQIKVLKQTADGSIPQNTPQRTNSKEQQPKEQQPKEQQPKEQQPKEQQPKEHLVYRTGNVGNEKRAEMKSSTKEAVKIHRTEGQKNIDEGTENVQRTKNIKNVEKIVNETEVVNNKTEVVNNKTEVVNNKTEAVNNKTEMVNSKEIKEVVSEEEKTKTVKVAKKTKNDEKNIKPARSRKDVFDKLNRLEKDPKNS